MTPTSCPRRTADPVAGGNAEQHHRSGTHPVAARPCGRAIARNGGKLTIDTPQNELEAAKALCDELTEILRLLRHAHRHFEQAESAQREARFFTKDVSRRGRSPADGVHRPHTNRVRLSRCRSINQRSIPPSNKGRSKGNRSLPPKALFHLQVRTLLPGTGRVVDRAETLRPGPNGPNRKQSCPGARRRSRVR